MSQSTLEKTDVLLEHQRVALIEPLPQYDLEYLDEGTIVYVYPHGLAYEVEFFEHGISVAVLTLTASQVQAVSVSDVADGDDFEF